jgi:hypothetical protein
MQTAQSRTFNICLSRSCAEVYDFLSQPQNLPQWASGLGEGIEADAETDTQAGASAWIVHTAAGAMKMIFAARNDYGVVDHTVYPPAGGEVYVPMRVVAHGAGSAVILTLFRQPGMSDEDYERDAQLIQQDLQRLQTVLAA